MEYINEDVSCLVELNKKSIIIKGDKNGYLKFLPSDNSSLNKKEDDLPLFKKKISNVAIIGLEIIDRSNSSNSSNSSNNVDKENVSSSPPSSSSSSKVLRVVLASAMMLEFIDPPLELLLLLNDKETDESNQDSNNNGDRKMQLATAMKKVNIIKRSLVDNDNDDDVFINDNMANIMILSLISNNSLNEASIVWNKFKQNITTRPITITPTNNINININTNTTDADKVLLTPLNLVRAMSKIPLDADLLSLVKWIESTIIPRLHEFESNHNDNSSSISVSSEEKREPFPLLLCAELCRRVRLLEENSGKPFTAVVAIELLRRLSSLIDPRSSYAEETSSETLKLCVNLEMQSKLWLNWKKFIRLEDLEVLGFEGFLKERLWNASEDTLEKEYIEHLKPLADTCGYHDLSQLENVIITFIQSVVNTHLVVFSAPTSISSTSTASNLRDNQEKVIHLSRLLKWTKLFKQVDIKSDVVLLLLQLTGDEADASSIGNDIYTKELLCMAKSLSTDITCSFQMREALLQSIRLSRLQQLASHYGCIGLNMRNTRQVSAVIAMILSKIPLHVCTSSSSSSDLDSTVKTVISHAQEFAQAFPSTVDSRIFYVRAVIACALCEQKQTSNSSNTTTTTSSSSSINEIDIVTREEMILAVLRCVPSEWCQTVVEEIISSLLCTLEDLSNVGMEHDVGSFQMDDDDLVEVCLSCRAAIITITFFLGEGSTDSCQGTSQAEGNTWSIGSKQKKSTWINQDLLLTLRRLEALQLHHNMCLSVRDITDGEFCRRLVLNMVYRQAHLRAGWQSSKSNKSDNNDNKEDEDKLPPTLPLHLHRICILLDVSYNFALHGAMKALNSVGLHTCCLEIAKHMQNMNISDGKKGNVIGSKGEGLTETQNMNDTSCILESAVELSSTAPRLQMTNITMAFRTSQSLLQHAAVRCNSIMLGGLLDTLSGTDLVLAALDRMAGRNASEDRNSNNSTRSPINCDSSDGVCLCESYYTHDGVLMTRSAILGPLLLFAAREMIRKRSWANGDADSSTTGAPDLMKLVNILHQHENHQLAVRVLLTSCCHDQEKAKALNTSLMALGFKLLCYRRVDLVLALACLSTSAVTYREMVHTLQSALPSVQVDSKRLYAVAVVGEGLARLWDSDSNSINNDNNIDNDNRNDNSNGLLSLFQSVQTNAHWWHSLESMGIRVDHRAFSVTKSQERDILLRQLLPQLLKHSNQDLDKAFEYCRHFDIPCSVAALICVEQLLLLPYYGNMNISSKVVTSGMNGMNKINRKKGTANTWLHLYEKKVRVAAAHTEEQALIGCFRGLLMQLDACDYERIHFVCEWLIELIDVDDDDNEENGEDMEEDIDTAVVEVRTYRSYLAIISNLRSLPLDIYEGVHTTTDETTDGIPLWSLLEDPWSTIEPIIQLHPLKAPLLAILCQSTALSRRLLTDDLYVYAARASMSFIINNHENNDKTECDFDTFVDGFKSLVELIQSPLQRAELWRWFHQQLSSSSFSSSGKVVRTLQRETEVEWALDVALDALGISSDQYNEDDNNRSSCVVLSLMEGGRDLVMDPHTDLDHWSTLVRDIVLDLVVLRCHRDLRQWNERTKTNYREDDPLLNIPNCFRFVDIDGDGDGDGAVQISSLRSLMQKDFKQVLMQLFLVGAHECWLELLHHHQLITSDNNSDCFLTTMSGGLFQIIGSSGNNDISSISVSGSGCSRVATMISYLDDISVRLAAHGVLISSAETVVEQAKQYANNSGLDQKQKRPQARRETTAPVRTALEAARHTLLTQLLSDSEIAAAASSPGDNNTRDRTFDLEKNKNKDIKHDVDDIEEDWTILFDDKSKGSLSQTAVLFQPTDYELRHREDIYRGLIAACLLAACTPEAQREVYKRQLHALARGKGGTRSMRRLTSRSRLRAAQVLIFLEGDNNNHNTTATTTTTTTTTTNNTSGNHNNSSRNAVNSQSIKDDADDHGRAESGAAIELGLFDLRAMLHCLAELERTRLVGCCRESTLNRALSKLSLISSSSSLSLSSSDMSSLLSADALVTTWLRDEGDVPQVSEICRDWLYYIHTRTCTISTFNSLSSIDACSTPWCELLQHMVSHHQDRALLQTLRILSDDSRLNRLLQMQPLASSPSSLMHANKNNHNANLEIVIKYAADLSVRTALAASTTVSKLVRTLLSPSASSLSSSPSLSLYSTATTSNDTARSNNSNSSSSWLEVNSILIPLSYRSNCELRNLNTTIKMSNKSKQMKQMVFLFAEAMISIDTVGALSSSAVAIGKTKIPDLIPNPIIGKKTNGGNVVTVTVCDQLRSVFSVFQDTLNDKDSENENSITLNTSFITTATSVLTHVASSLLTSSASSSTDTTALVTHLLQHTPAFTDCSYCWRIFCIICNRFKSETITAALNSLVVNCTGEEEGGDSESEIMSIVLSLISSASRLWVHGSSRLAAMLYLEWIATQSSSLPWISQRVRGLKETDRVNLRTAFETTIGSVPTALIL